MSAKKKRPDPFAIPEWAVAAERRLRCQVKAIIDELEAFEARLGRLEDLHPRSRRQGKP